MVIKIHVWQTGKVRVSEAVPYKSKNPLAILGIGKEKMIELPVSCYLIEYDNKKILVDTGWDSKLEKEKITRFWGLVDKISHPIIKKEEAIDKRLDNLGIKDSDLDYVILSHLDLDHVSGLCLVKNAKKILVSDEEIIDAKKNRIRYDKSLWDDVNLERFKFNDTGVGPVGKSYDLFNDGKVMLVNTPGHSHGHISVMVKNKGKYVIIAGDSVYTHKSWIEEKIPGFTVSKKLAYKSMRWIKELVKDDNCIEVLPNHDYEVKEHIIEL